MVMEDDLPPPNTAESREPTAADLRNLCLHLNQRGARYIVIGG